MINLEHIHPMLVHFPITLLLLAVLIDFLVLIRKQNLAASGCLSTSGFYVLLLAAVGAIAAASFGDIALDRAVELGFDKSPLEEHEELGLAALWIMLGLAGWQLVARWRKMPLYGTAGWVFFALALIGSGVLLAAAYHGGELVYALGVNVAPVRP